MDVPKYETMRGSLFLVSQVIKVTLAFKLEEVFNAKIYNIKYEFLKKLNEVQTNLNSDFLKLFI